MTMPRLLTLRQVSDVLGCSTQHARRLILRGRLPGINLSLVLGRARWGVREDHLREFLNQTPEAPGAPGSRRSSSGPGAAGFL